jgi:hypothetical protein
MNNEDKKRITAMVRAAEYMFLENNALKLVLEYREVPHWQKPQQDFLNCKILNRRARREKPRRTRRNRV